MNPVNLVIMVDLMILVNILTPMNIFNLVILLVLLFWKI